MRHVSTLARSVSAIHWSTGTSPSVEWAWLAARLIITAVIVPMSLAAFDSGYAYAAVIIGAAGVLAYSGALAYLLRRGHINVTFWTGFILDNAIIFSSWWWTARTADPGSLDGEMWPVILPVIIVGVVRLGAQLGVLYIAAWIAAFSWLTLGYQASDSFNIEQLPIRLVFVAIVGGLTIWLVTKLKSERQTAWRLQEESEQIAEIGRVITSSLTPISVFPSFASRLKSLIPYQRLGLVEIDYKSGSFWMVSSDGNSLPAMPEGQAFPLPQGGPALKVMAGKEPIMLDEAGCNEFFRHFPEGVQPYASNSKSMIISPIITGDTVIGVIFARSSIPGIFTRQHMQILVRVADYISSAMANAQLYRQTIELAKERESRLKLDSENQSLHRQNFARTMFLSAVSHELRTPLTSIIAFNDMLLKNREGHFSEREMVQLNVMRRNSQQLYVLVNDLLDLSHIESGKMQLSPEAFDVSEAIKEIANSIEPVLKPRRQRLVIDAPQEKAMLTADRQRFAQVVSNLLSNASKYSPEGKEIRLRWKTEDGKLEVSVIDRGSGMPAHDMPLLFEPFFRAAKHRAGKIPGTGLGLVISKSLVEAHGGEIWLESTEGKGTTASFWLPLDGSGLRRSAQGNESAVA